MQAKLHKDRVKPNSVAANRKENKFFKQLTAINKDLRSIIVLRFYATDSRVYACIWVHGHKSELEISGGGYAGGYGYDKLSTAAEIAINNAGIELSVSIGGRGEPYVYDALGAIMKMLGYRRYNIISSHG